MKKPKNTVGRCLKDEELESFELAAQLGHEIEIGTINHLNTCQSCSIRLVDLRLELGEFPDVDVSQNEQERDTPLTIAAAGEVLRKTVNFWASEDGMIVLRLEQDAADNQTLRLITTSEIAATHWALIAGNKKITIRSDASNPVPHSLDIRNEKSCTLEINHGEKIIKLSSYNDSAGT